MNNDKLLIKTTNSAISKLGSKSKLVTRGLRDLGISRNKKNSFGVEACMICGRTTGAFKHNGYLFWYQSHWTETYTHFSTSCFFCGEPLQPGRELASEYILKSQMHILMDLDEIYKLSECADETYTPLEGLRRNIDLEMEYRKRNMAIHPTYFQGARRSWEQAFYINTRLKYLNCSKNKLFIKYVEGGAPFAYRSAVLNPDLQRDTYSLKCALMDFVENYGSRMFDSSRISGFDQLLSISKQINNRLENVNESLENAFFESWKMHLYRVYDSVKRDQSSIPERMLAEKIHELLHYCNQGAWVGALFPASFSNLGRKKIIDFINCNKVEISNHPSTTDIEILNEKAKNDGQAKELKALDQLNFDGKGDSWWLGWRTREILNFVMDLIDVDRINEKKEYIYRNFGGKAFYYTLDQKVLICLENDVDQRVIDAVANEKPERVVFRDDGFKNEIVRISAESNLKKAGVEAVHVFEIKDYYHSGMRQLFRMYLENILKRCE